MIEVTSASQLKSLLDENQDKNLFILKHSTRCPVSAMAFAQFERFASKHKNVVCAFIKLIENREASNLLTELSGVAHESPQVIQFNIGEMAWSVTHSEIQEDALDKRAADAS